MGCRNADSVRTHDASLALHVFIYFSENVTKLRFLSINEVSRSSSFLLSSAGKPRSSSIPAESVITQQVRPVATAAALPQALPIEEVPVSPEDVTPTTPSVAPVVSPSPGAERDGRGAETSSKASTPLPSPPFLLLSQEVRSQFGNPQLE